MANACYSNDIMSVWHSRVQLTSIIHGSRESVTFITCITLSNILVNQTSRSSMTSCHQDSLRVVFPYLSYQTFWSPPHQWDSPMLTGDYRPHNNNQCVSIWIYFSPLDSFWFWILLESALCLSFSDLYEFGGGIYAINLCFFPLWFLWNMTQSLIRESSNWPTNNPTNRQLEYFVLI